MLDITKDIQSLTTFRRRSGDFMKQLKESQAPYGAHREGESSGHRTGRRSLSAITRYCRSVRRRGRHPSGA